MARPNDPRRSPSSRAGQGDERYLVRLSRAERRARGVFYTPGPLVDYVVHETLTARMPGVGWHHDGAPELRILDPAAGSGRFLVACVEWLVAEAGRRGVAGRSTRRAIVRRCVVGVERDPVAAAAARRALGAGADVCVGEALLTDVAAVGAWDVVVGNPPYVRAVTLRREEPTLWQALRGRFAATSHGEWDLYAAFLERALAWCAPGGEVGLVVPSRWLTSSCAGSLRLHLARAGVVRRIVDFGARQVFSDATTYTALVFLSRAKHARSVAVARWVGPIEAGHTSLPPGPGWSEGRVRVAGSAAWQLAVGPDAAVLCRLAAGRPRLADLARISKGAGTNADDVFVLDAEAATGIEPELLVPCLRGRDVRQFAMRRERVALLPYSDHGLLGPDALASRYPKARAYLESRRSILEARERGRFVGTTFYRWGRPQNLAWLRDRAAKLVVPDAAARGRCALDREGRLVLDSAYALRPLTGCGEVVLGLILAVLNSSVVATWLRATGIPLRGGYFRMKTAYLSSLPIPDPSLRAAREVARAALGVGGDDAAAQGELETRVLALYA